jgi:PPOX class probable F420-dependent enzyme
MTEDEQRAFLESGHTAIVTSVSGDGFPHSVAMWYVVLDGGVSFWTYTTSQKVINYRRNPKAAVLVEDGRSYADLRGLLIQGSAEVHDDPEVVYKVGRGLFLKYTAGAEVEELSDDAQRLLRARSAKRSVVVINPIRITSWDHRKLGGAY